MAKSQKRNEPERFPARKRDSATRALVKMMLGAGDRQGFGADDAGRQSLDGECRLREAHMLTLRA